MTSSAKWVGLTCGNSDYLKTGYLYTFQSSMQGTIRDGDLTVTAIPKQTMTLTVHPFSGYLRELKVFSDALDPATMFQLS